MTIYFIIQTRILIRLKGKLLVTPELTWENHDMWARYLLNTHYVPI